MTSINTRKTLLLVPGAFSTSAGKMFGEVFDYDVTSDLDAVSSVDYVCFLGGADIDPRLYGEEPHSTTYYNRKRDFLEVSLWGECREYDKPTIGICRGAQLLHALNGGKLWQDVQGHAGGNHLCYDTETGESFESSSVHHQMLRIPANPRFHLKAVSRSRLSTTYETYGVAVTEDVPEVEAAYYLDTKCFLTQGHPEIGPPEYVKWFKRSWDEFLNKIERNQQACAA